MKTYIYDYPSGDGPRFCIHGSYVYSIPEDEPVYLITGTTWSEWPGGGLPTFVQRGNLVYPSASDTPRYCVKASP